MRIYPLLAAALVVSICAAAQVECTDGFAKVFPEPHTDYSLDFGRSVSIHQNFMAVGVPDSDTISRKSGIVYIYEKIDGSWTRIASMVAAEAIPDLELGISVKLTANYLFASASAGGGSVYVYRRPPAGWTTATETTIIAAGNTQAFGVAYHHPVDLSEDENTLVVADAMKPHNSSPITIAGSIFVFHKSAGVEWSNDITPVEIKATTKTIDLGRTGTYIRGNRIYTGTPFTPSGTGNILIYYDAAGDFSNPVLEASLSAVAGGGLWMDNMVVTEAGIFVCGRTPASGLKIYFYPIPADGVWSGVSPSCLIDPDGSDVTTHAEFIRIGATSTGLFAIFVSATGESVAKLTPGSTGWCSPAVEIIETRATPRYGALVATGELGDVAIGFVSHPWNSFSPSALEVYSEGGDSDWTSSLVYSTAESTKGHAYGQAVAVHNDVMFVGAPLDNEVTTDRGKVYVYHQSTTESPWLKIAEFAAPGSRLFGKGLATNGDHLAVGTHFGEHARILIYRKGIEGWTYPEFVQQIEVPSGEILSPTYGETIVMNERWLLIPFVDARGFSAASIAVYELEDGVWAYRQTLGTDYNGIFTGTPNCGVAISGDVLVAANRVYELDDNGGWAYACRLFPSDPETFRFSFPSFQVTSNGSNFGRSVAIHENTIAIGAPRRDSDNGVWDVGAVYVFTKAPDQDWKDKAETMKIVPAEINRSGLFGWDVAFAEHVLIIGAPTAANFANPDLNESPRNNAQGKVYLYKAEDTSWKRPSLITILKGETSFRDNFGVAVAYSNERIFAGASEEDISSGRTSGSVYITDAPTAIKPVEPMCVDDAVVTLRSLKTGGIWSGSGITDGTKGEFDPSAAGPGVHEITYVRGMCSRSSKVSILVAPRVHGEIDGPAEVLVCATPISFNRTISAVALSGVSLEWQYRPAGGAFVTIAGASSPELTATRRGEYRVYLSNEGCEAYSDTLAIRDEVVELTLIEPGEVCGTPDEGIALTAFPERGTWSGPGVRENKFTITGVNDGEHALNYQYTSALGCVYTGETTVTVQRIPLPLILRQGNLCQTGVVTYENSRPAIDGVDYTWYHQAPEGGEYEEVGSGVIYQATTWGSYKLIATKGDCSAASGAAVLKDSFTSELHPRESSGELCYDHAMMLSFPPDESSSFEWHYSADGQSTELLPENGHSIRPGKTGYYTGTIRRGVCSFTGPTKFFYVHARDSVFVPNVFTPNGDGKNDSFSIILFHQDDDHSDGDPADVVSYDVYNRYGRKVYSAPGNQPWTGEGSESAVYLWYGTYYSCHGEPRRIKGIVHLVR